MKKQGKISGRGKIIAWLLIGPGALFVIANILMVIGLLTDGLGSDLGYFGFLLASGSGILFIPCLIGGLVLASQGPKKTK